MARVGLSKPYGAIYTYDSTTGTVTYGTPTVLGKAVQLDFTAETAGENNLYADNAIAESYSQFAGGSLEFTVDELSPSVMATILGITAEGTGTAWLKFNDSQATPYMGFGAVLKKIVNGVVKYQAIVYRKIIFANMDESLVTQGDEIEWGTPTISATVMRDDTDTHDWKWISPEADTEAAAVAYITEAFS